jgi:hypothetical protein
MIAVGVVVAGILPAVEGRHPAARNGNVRRKGQRGELATALTGSRAFPPRGTRWLYIRQDA